MRRDPAHRDRQQRNRDRRRAQVVRFNGLSAHADRNGLLAYARAISPSPSRIFVVHGEEQHALSLAEAIRAQHPSADVTVPSAGTPYEL